MQRNTYQIFEPDTTTRAISNDKIALSLFLLLLILFPLTFQIAKGVSWIYMARLIAVIFVVLLTSYWAISSIWSYEKLHGNYAGELEFFEDRIRVNGMEINLKDIKCLDLILSNYYGRNVRLSGIGFSPMRSQGVNNYIAYWDYKGMEFRVYFRLNDEYQYKELRPFLFSAIQQERISFLRGLALLNINEYEEIQKIKTKIFK